MPNSSGLSASRRLLSLLSLLQVRRDWPGDLLADRLEVSPRTVRRDVDRLRELGYRVRATKGPDGGYRLDAGAQLPPLLFDDEQAVALALALQSAALVGAGIEEAAARALGTLRQVLPTRLRARLDALEATVVPHPAGEPADPDVLLAVGAAVRRREELRFDYRSPAAVERGEDEARPRRVHPHHLLARAGRWYLLAWEPKEREWRTYRVDRMKPWLPSGPRFVPRAVPGGDPAVFLAGRFKGSEATGTWPCTGDVVLGSPAAAVLPFAGDGVVEALDQERCRVRLGSWSWAGLAASLARFDTDVDVLDPPELRDAFAALARRAARAAGRAKA